MAKWRLGQKMAREPPHRERHNINWERHNINGERHDIKWKRRGGVGWGYQNPVLSIFQNNIDFVGPRHIFAIILPESLVNPD